MHTAREFQSIFLDALPKLFHHWGMNFSDYTPIDDRQVSAEDLQNVSQQIDQHAPDQWTELAEIAYKVLRHCPQLEAVPDIGIGLCAIRVVYQLATELGGDAVYVPKGTKPSIEARNAEMLAAFTGDNVNELARKYRVTPMRLRQILATEAARKRGTNAPKGTGK